MSVYRYSGADMPKDGQDPRRTDEYRQKVIDGLGFGKDATRKGLTEEDMAACREVLWRKAGAFWIEGHARTALRYLLHDTIPTGPPCRTPPHRLKGEEADWVDEQLQKEVLDGQLIRGNSEWASPPFATKAFAEHRRQRKRRVVVDYRRVNARILRAVYCVRNADAVVHEVAGSMWMSLVDACKGFNQVANTRRAREMLAILARSGQYLPVCLTFGPTNGPEDFAFATDRVFAPGRGRKMRFCTNWQIYADDITVRSLVALEHRTHSNTGFLCSSNVFHRTLEHMFLLPSCRLEHAEHLFEHTNTPRTPNTPNTVQSQAPRTHSEFRTRTRDQDIHISASTAILPKHPPTYTQ